MRWVNDLLENELFLVRLNLNKENMAIISVLGKFVSDFYSLSQLFVNMHNGFLIIKTHF